MAAFEAWLVLLILVVNVVGELQRKRTLAASRGFLAAARLSCSMIHPCDRRTDGRAIAYTRYSIYAVARNNIVQPLLAHAEKPILILTLVSI